MGSAVGFALATGALATGAGELAAAGGDASGASPGDLGVQAASESAKRASEVRLSMGAQTLELTSMFPVRGSWYSAAPKSFTILYAITFDKALRGDFLGFRCVRSAADAGSASPASARSPPVGPRPILPRRRSGERIGEA